MIKNLSIKIKLIIIFIFIKIIPLVIIAYLAFEGVKKLEILFEEKAQSTLNSSYQVVNDTAQVAIEDSITALDKKSQEALEIRTKDIAAQVAQFLYERDSDIKFLSSVDRISESFLKSFYQSKTKQVIVPQEFEYNYQVSKWEPRNPIVAQKGSIEVILKDNEKYFNHNTVKEYKTKHIPIYKEISFIDLHGMEQFKYSSIDSALKNISKKENTYCKAEDYFKEIRSLQKGEIYVSDVIGEYVGTKVLGEFTKEKAKKLGIEFTPEKHAYAGLENPKGKTFEGIIRFVMPRYENGEKVGYITLALDHQHIMEFTDYVIPTKEAIRDYSDASSGNYAFMWDYQARNISHPRDYFIYGYDKETGKKITPWLSLDVAEKLKTSNLEWEEFLNTYPKYENQSLRKKPNLSQLTQDGKIPLDCRYLNFAPQCQGWKELTKDGGYGSFVIYWSKVWKLTTVAAIPYYTGKYGESKRGFGFITMGANLEQFHKATETTKANIDQLLMTKQNEIKEVSEKTDKEVHLFVKQILNSLIISTFIMTIIVIFIAIWMAKSITSPLKILVRGTKEFQKKNLDYRIAVKSNDEIGTLASSFNQMAEAIKLSFKKEKEFSESLEVKVQERTKALAEKNEELQILYITDRLTGLYNRYKLDEYLSSEILRVKRNKKPFSIILMDIDYFKNVNDTYGHQSGDLLLIEFAQIIKSNIREVDIAGRWGGEEFLIICPETDLDGVYHLAEKLRKIIEEYEFSAVKNQTASFGVSMYKQNDTVKNTIHNADKLLYKAKNSGRNCVCKE